jgi:hypothetical protein
MPTIDFDYHNNNNTLISSYESVPLQKIMFVVSYIFLVYCYARFLNRQNAIVHEMIKNK